MTYLSNELVNELKEILEVDYKLFLHPGELEDTANSLVGVFSILGESILRESKVAGYNKTVVQK